MVFGHAVEPLHVQVKQHPEMEHISEVFDNDDAYDRFSDDIGSSDAGSGSES